MTSPSWMSSAAARKRRNARSVAQEASVAREAGGRVQSGSGSSWRAPGDVRAPGQMIECKYTDKKSFSLTTTIIRKIIKAAENNGREPRLVIDFVTEGIRAVVTFEDI